MFEIAGTSYAIDIVYTFTALLLLFLGLRWLDARNGRPWKDTIEKIREDSLAASIYYAARWVGACLFIGMLLSR